MLYGQLHKRYQRRRLARIKYQMQCGTRGVLRATLLGLGWSGKPQTAFVERVNLTVRQSVAALTCPTAGPPPNSSEILAPNRDRGIA